MSYVIAAPEMMTSAATDLAAIGANVDAAHKVAAAPTVAVIPAAADEVSTGIAHVFAQHAANYQALAGQAAAFNDQFVQHLTAAAFSYAGTEANLAALLQNLQILSVDAGHVLNHIFTLPPQQGLTYALQLIFGALVVAAIGAVIGGYILAILVAYPVLSALGWLGPGA